MTWLGYKSLQSNSITSVVLDVCRTVETFHVISTGCCQTSIPSVGCCQTSIPRSDFLDVELDDLHTLWGREKTFQCSFAFIGMIGDFGNFTYKLSDLDDPKAFLKNNKEFIDKPLALDWRIGPDLTCTETSCGKNSLCNIYWDSLHGGYECMRKEGYEGNPYLGCQDIDECTNYPCASNGICNNTLGSYECYCRDGDNGDGRKNGIGCIRGTDPIGRVSHLAAGSYDTADGEPQRCQSESRSTSNKIRPKNSCTETRIPVGKPWLNKYQLRREIPVLN